MDTIKENSLLLLRGHHLKITDHKKIEKNFSEMVDDIRAPAAWRRPKTKIYDYNQDMGCAYYKVRQRQRQ